MGEESVIWEYLEDGSSNVQTGGQPVNFVEVTIRQVRREMVPEYRELQKRWKAAYEASSDKPPVSRRILLYGDNAGITFKRNAAFNTWAERDGWRITEILREQLGEEGSRVNNMTMSRVLESSETFIVARRPELSRTATSPTSD